MADRPTTFNADARRRIANAVRRVERSPIGAGEDGGADPRHERSFCLAQNSAHQVAGDSPATTWTIYAGTPGSETATSITSFPTGVYVREGLCFKNTMYRLMEINGIHEVMNPSMRFRGVADASIAADATGTVSIYYRSGSTAYTDTTINATCLNDLDATVPSAADVEVSWDSDGTTARWKIVQSDFSC
jgi:hypothetical protein